MSAWMKLLIPLALGIVAAIVNFAVLKQSVSSREFVVARVPIESGQEITQDLLTTREVSGHAAAMLKSAVPAEGHESLVLGRRAGRHIEADDLLLWQDVNVPSELAPRPGEDALTISLDGVAVVPRLLIVGQEVTFIVNIEDDPTAVDPTQPLEAAARFEPIGPFRLLSIGPRLSRIADDDSGNDLDGGRNITIAIPATQGEKFDRMTQRLLDAISRSTYGQAAIRAMIIHSREDVTG